MKMSSSEEGSEHDELILSTGLSLASIKPLRCFKDQSSRAAVGMAFQSPYPSHTHRNPHWNPHGNPHTHGSPAVQSICPVSVFFVVVSF